MTLARKLTGVDLTGTTIMVGIATGLHYIAPPWLAAVVSGKTPRNA